MLFTTNKKKLLRHFLKDPVLFAYHIGDLDDFYFPDCQWAAAFGKRTGIDDVLLTYSGCDTPSLLAFGLSEHFPELLLEYLPIAPKKFYCHFQKQHHHILTRFADETPLGTHQKMKLDEVRFRAFGNSNDHSDIKRLGDSDETALRELYANAYPENYFVPRMLQTGKYFGVVDNGSIVAVAGVHVVSDEQRIAVLGNATTHFDHRGRGLATRLIHHLATELVDEGKMICLNVRTDNAPAIACYEKLGFVKVHEYQEALFELR